MRLTKIASCIATALIGVWASSAQAYTVTTGYDVPSSVPVAPEDRVVANGKSDAYQTVLNAAVIDGSVVNTVGTQDFEKLTPGAIGSSGLQFDIGGVTATLSGSQGSVENTASLGRYSVSSSTSAADQGSQYLQVTAGDVFTISFSSNVTAFSFWGTDIGDFDGTFSIQLLDADGKQIGATIDVNKAAGIVSGAETNGAVLFFGLLAQSSAEAFRSIRFITSGTAGKTDGYGFDYFSVGSLVTGGGGGGGGDVPEPGSLALAGLALAGLSAARRRR